MKPNNTSNLLAALVLGLSTATTFAAFNGSDDFNDNSKDLTKWGPDIVSGSAALTETNLRLEYTVAGGTATALRPWVANTGSYTSDWSLQLDVNLPTLALTTGQAYHIGLTVRNGDDTTDTFLTALELDNISGTPSRVFLSVLNTNGSNQGEVTSTTTSTSAAVRMRYDAASTTLFSEFDANGAVGGYNFTGFDSRNISTWNMTASSVFQATVFGGSESGVVITSASGVAGDNFQSVPEPSSALLLLSGAALCLRRRPLRTSERSA